MYLLTFLGIIRKWVRCDLKMGKECALYSPNSSWKLYPPNVGQPSVENVARYRFGRCAKPCAHKTTVSAVGVSYLNPFHNSPLLPFNGYFVRWNLCDICEAPPSESTDGTIWKFKIISSCVHFKNLHSISIFIPCFHIARIFHRCMIHRIRSTKKERKLLMIYYIFPTKTIWIPAIPIF